jgi:hypothetical protein
MEDIKTNNAKFAFYYMLSLVSLAFIAIGIGMVIFQAINKYVADQLVEYQTRFNPDLIRYATSMIIVAAPIFYAVMRQIFKSLADGRLDKDAGVRRWLVYFILFISAVIVIGTLVNTLNSFLNGELTLKFILKALTVGGIAAIVFSFYLYDIRREDIVGVGDRTIAIYFYGSLVIIVATLIFSLLVIESPSTARNRKMDNAILNNFDQIDSALTSYYSEKKSLPSFLDELRTEYNYLSEDAFVDPATGVKFDYRIKSLDEYELCATFRLTSEADSQYNFDNSLIQRWPHAGGYQCLGQKVHGVKSAAPVPAGNL